MTSTFNASLQKAICDVLLSRLDDGISQTPLDIYVRCAKLEQQSQAIQAQYKKLKEEDVRLTKALTRGDGHGEVIVEKLQRLAEGLEEVDGKMCRLRRERRGIEREVRGWVEGRVRVIAREIKERDEGEVVVESRGRMKAAGEEESRRDSGMEMSSVEKSLEVVAEEVEEEEAEVVNCGFSIDLLLPADGKI